MVRLSCLIKIYENGPKEDPTELDFVNSIEIEESWREFTTTASVILPRYKIGNPESFTEHDQAFRRRMLQWSKSHPEIEIFLGYETPKHLAFKGIIREIKGRVPVELICEDHMYFLKTGGDQTISYPERKGDQFIGITIYEFIRRHFTVLKRYGIKIDLKTIIRFLLGSVVLRRFSPIKFLKLLKDVYGIYSFIRYLYDGSRFVPQLWIGTEYFFYSEDEVVIEEREFFEQQRIGFVSEKFAAEAGLPFSLKSKKYGYSGPKGFFRFHDNIIEDELIYKDYGDVKVRVKYILQGKTEQDQLVVMVPKPPEKDEDDDAEEITYKIYNPNFILNKEKFKDDKKVIGIVGSDQLTSLDPAIREVLSLALKKLRQLKYSGFRGSFTTFGETLYVTSKGEKAGDHIRPGDIIELRDQPKQGTIADFKLNDQFYFVDAVEHYFGVEGFRQIIYLGAAVDGDRITTEEINKIEVQIFIEFGGSVTSIEFTAENEVFNLQLIGNDEPVPDVKLANQEIE